MLALEGLGAGVGLVVARPVAGIAQQIGDAFLGLADLVLQPQDLLLELAADLGKLGRPLKDIIIVDNSPASYLFNPENAVPIDSWFDDPNDTELLDLIPFLEDISSVFDVTSVLSPT